MREATRRLFRDPFCSVSPDVASPHLVAVVLVSLPLFIIATVWYTAKEVYQPVPLTCCGPGCRSDGGAMAHYDEKYLDWQRGKGLRKAAAHDWTALLGVQKGDVVLDFGAGTGAILSSLTAAERRIAVEYSPAARRYMQTHDNTLETYQYPEEVPAESVDLVYSTSVIEHVECPVQELRALLKALKPGGRIVLGVKNEGVELWQPWHPDNADKHLWTWNAKLLGNVLDSAGYVLVCVDAHGGARPGCTGEDPTPERLAYLRRQRQRIQEGITSSQFGRRTHVFQYIWFKARKLKEGENPEWARRPMGMNLNRAAGLGYSRSRGGRRRRGDANSSATLRSIL